MIIYLDTSVWVKLYVRETGSKELRVHTTKAEVMAVFCFAVFDQRLRAAAERAALVVAPCMAALKNAHGRVWTRCSGDNAT